MSQLEKRPMGAANRPLPLGAGEDSPVAED